MQSAGPKISNAKKRKLFYLVAFEELKIENCLQNGSIDRYRKDSRKHSLMLHATGVNPFSILSCCHAGFFLVISMLFFFLGFLHIRSGVPMTGC